MLAEIAYREFLPEAQLFKEGGGGVVVGFDVGDDEVEAVAAERGVTCLHQGRGDAAALVGGVHGQAIDPAFSVIVAAEDDADDAIPAKSDQIGIGKSANLLGERFPAFAPLRI